MISNIMQSKKTLTKINELDLNTFVVCLECNTKHPQITHTHLKKAHSMTLDEYVLKHNLKKPDLYCISVKELRKVTLDNMIKKYGEEEGTKKWNLYKERQARSNSFEYKQEKYGWTKEQYDLYNNSRASTKANFIKRHGVEEGTKKWKEYCKRQSYAGVTEEYFIEKYGTVEGALKFKEVCSKKSNTLETFIQRYGEIIGKEKWERFVTFNSQNVPQSRLANELFSNILAQIPNELHQNIFFAAKNTEYFFAKKGHKTMFVDFYCASSKKIIEFAGNYWHGNPALYQPNFYNTRTKCTAKELYENTIKRNQILEEVHGCKVLLIWESDYTKDKESVIEKCLKFLNE